MSLIYYNLKKKKPTFSFSKFIEKIMKNGFTARKNQSCLTLLLRKKSKTRFRKRQSFTLMVDNLRYDQWKVIETFRKVFYNKGFRRRIFQHFTYCHSIRQKFIFCRFNAFGNRKAFSRNGLMTMKKAIKMSTKRILEDQMKRIGLQNKSMKYLKVLNADFERKILDDFNQHKNNDLLVIVYNFIDILSHAKTDNHIVDN